MKNQNMRILAMLALAVLVIPSFALAAETVDNTLPVEPVDEITEKEIATMNIGIGAEVRLLQLEKAITKSILKGEEVIAIHDSLGDDTTALSEILDEMQALLVEVQSADPEADDVVQTFVDLKSDARDLVKEFRIARMELRQTFDNATMAQLQTRLREIDMDGRPQLAQNKEQIRNRIREHNAQRLEMMPEAIGENATAVMAQLRNGELTTAQVKAKVTANLATMAAAKKETLLNKVREEATKRAVFTKNQKEQAENNFAVRKTTRTSARLQKAEQIRTERAVTMNSRTAQMQSMRDEVKPLPVKSDTSMK